ncbi:phosphoglycerate mutase-like protein [Apiospora marii]|uniref:Phosphoglycerate mutase-like protein n=1 Tax=Apiospora marii TaxID=335849 RepID=A0ABR1RFJ5_9PEZI
MVPSGLRTLAALLLLGLRGEAEAEQIVWSSFAYILHGERTPLSTDSLSATLTTYGAQQMFAQGQMFRDRYLLSTGNDDGNATDSFPIVGLSRRALDNSQLDIMTNTDTFNVASAMAFMQGLYPPAPGAFVENDGGRNASTLANGSLVDFPLDGYQYPNIQAVSSLDERSFQMQGQVSCSTYMGSQLEASDDEIIRRNTNESVELYNELSRTIFAGTAPFEQSSSADNFYDQAYDLWDYAAYQYTHNSTVHDGLGEDVLNRLGQLASDQQFDYNGNLTASGSQPGDRIRAIAGRTLAARAAAQLRSQIAGGFPHKLSLMVGSFEPMLAFFALSQLADDASSSLRFRTIPAPGSAMVFELFSVSDDDNNNNDGSPPQQYPAEDDLWIRFLYRYGTDASAPLVEYPIFGRSNSQSSMKWWDFRSQMDDIAVDDLSEWCRLCSAPTLFCAGIEANAADGNSSSSAPSYAGGSYDRIRSRMSPTVGGVIGAIVTLGLLTLAGLAAFFLGGLRVRRRGQRQDAGVQRSGSLGGFKGAEKMASDKDLSLARGGGRHERVGSWEMGGPATPPNVATRGDRETTFGATVVRQLNDDGVSIIEEEPVKPREAV